MYGIELLILKKQTSKAERRIIVVLSTIQEDLNSLSKQRNYYLLHRKYDSFSLIDLIFLKKQSTN